MSVVSPQNLSLLGVPLFEEGIDNELNARLMALKLTCSRLEQLDHHDALFLFKNMLFTPKCQYLLRSFPCHGRSIIDDVDLRMKNCFVKITNSVTFSQASLPGKFGGLGIRCTADICLPLPSSLRLLNVPQSWRNYSAQVTSSTSPFCCPRLP